MILQNNYHYLYNYTTTSISRGMDTNNCPYILLFYKHDKNILSYEFIYKNGEEVIDGALQKKIIVCSPLTMFAILSVIRQSMDNFAISKTSGEILEVLGGFEKQWENF